MSRLDETQGTQGQSIEEDYAPPVGAKFSGEVSTPSSLTFPRLTMAQALSKAVTEEGSTAKMGDWIVSGYPEEKEVIFIPMQYGISRRFPTYQDNGQPITIDNRMQTDCYSPTGNEHGIGIPGIACEGCSLKEWQERPSTHPYQGNWQPCIKSYDFIGYSVTHQTPVQISLSKTSSKAGEMLEMLAFTRKFGNFAVKLSSERITNKNNQTYVRAKVTILSAVDAEAMEMAKALLQLPG